MILLEYVFLDESRPPVLMSLKYCAIDGTYPGPLGELRSSLVRSVGAEGGSKGIVKRNYLRSSGWSHGLSSRSRHGNHAYSIEYSYSCVR